MSLTPAVERLQRIFRERDLSQDEILSQVETVFGNIEAVVVTGSLAVGLGNRRSDIDLQVIVDAEQISSLPLPSFAKGSLIDVEYFSSTRLRSMSGQIKGTAWLDAVPSNGEDFATHQRSLFKLSRFATGHPLSASAAWHTWHADLCSGWLDRRITEWHRTEALRRLMVGDWLFSAKPLLACHRYCEAVLSAAEVRAAVAGDVYQDYESKWVLTRLKRLGLEDAHAMTRRLLEVPVNARDAGGYQAAAKATVRALLAASDLGMPTSASTVGIEVQLWLHPEARRYDIGPITILNMHGLRAIELRDFRLPAGQTNEQPLARVQYGAPLPEHLSALFLEDWLWVTLSRSAA